MIVTQLREDDVIAAIREIVGEARSKRIYIGIGDDAAAWQPSRSHRSVITTDMLVEGVHFSQATMSLRDAGWRAMAANASDLAAMGARPVLATVALGVPANIDVDAIAELYRGLVASSHEVRFAIVGGDLSRSDAITIAITAVGEVRASNLKTRTGARLGDVLAVTGALGASRAGLFCALGRASLSAEDEGFALEAHRTPHARVAEGTWLCASRNVHALMDCSDGLSTDLARLCAASGVGALVESVPVAPCARAMAEKLCENPSAFALAGGEDFELLAAIDHRAFAHLATRFAAHFGRPLHFIGRTRNGSSLALLNGEREEPLAPTGWEHFAVNP